MSILLRPAHLGDLTAINEIYNEAVLHTVATFDTVAKTIGEREIWFKSRLACHPVWVSEWDGEVRGWASLNPWSDRLAYRETAEISLYVHAQYRGQGLGSLLLPAILKAGREGGIHAILARITEGNEGSIRLHQRNGFVTVGVLHEVGIKFGKRLDVTLMELQK